MTVPTKTLLTIVTERSLEATLLREIEKLGAKGYTVTDARGKGDRGARSAGWDPDSNIRVEIICSKETADAISVRMREAYYDNYAMIIYAHEVTVLRPDKF